MIPTLAVSTLVGTAALVAWYLTLSRWMRH
jgi:hypothetical protein